MCILINPLIYLLFVAKICITIPLIYLLRTTDTMKLNNTDDKIAAKYAIHSMSSVQWISGLNVVGIADMSSDLVSKVEVLFHRKIILSKDKD